MMHVLVLSGPLLKPPIVIAATGYGPIRTIFHHAGSILDSKLSRVKSISKPPLLLLQEIRF